MPHPPGQPPSGRDVGYNTGMNIIQNVPLANYSTMRLGGTGAYLVEVHDRSEVQEAAAWASERQLPIVVVGTGSNIVWRDEGFNGLIIVNKIMGFEEQQEDDENYYVTVGAGENWDSVVARTAAKGMTGIEALALIPGTAGATPVQNVGAYGQEVANTIVSLEAYDCQTKQVITLQNSDCGFGYRTSRFKGIDHGRFIITHLTFHLLHQNPQPPFYPALQQYFDEHGITDRTPAIVRAAVSAIRAAKLPDPAMVANTGSFFANPIISLEKLDQLQDANNAGVPNWPTGDGQAKIPAAWLVEHAGFKDAHDSETGMGTWPTQALVLVNEHAATTAQLLAFKQKIVDAVQQKFGITLVQEPELLPA